MILFICCAIASWSPCGIGYTKTVAQYMNKYHETVVTPVEESSVPLLTVVVPMESIVGDIMVWKYKQCKDVSLNSARV